MTKYISHFLIVLEKNCTLNNIIQNKRWIEIMLKEMFMAVLKNLLFIMSFSGSTVFLLYVISYPLAKRYFSLKWKYTILKMAVAFYLIPFSSFKYLILKGMYHLGWLEQQKKFQKTDTLVSDYMIVFSRNLPQFSLKVKHILVVMFLMSIVAVFLFLKQAIAYRKMSRLYFASTEDEEDKYKECFLRLKEELNIKRTVKFIRSEYCHTPMSGGFFSSTIVFPVQEDETWGDGAYQDIIKHELAHVKHHDSWMKFLSVAVMIVHWFNPLSYALFYELSIVSEMYADRVVLQEKGDEERCKYGKMILELAAKSKDSGENRFFSSIAQQSTKIMYKRRVLEMRANRKSKRMLSILAAGIICVAGSITSVAYEPSNMLYDETGYMMSTNISLVAGEVEQEVEVLPYDYYCIDEKGCIHDLSNVDKDVRAICIHEFISGTAIEHYEDGKGGCVVRTYEAQICEICGYAKTKKLISTVTYNPCPH